MKVLSFPLSSIKTSSCWPRKVVKVGNLKSVWIWDLRCRVKSPTGPSKNQVLHPFHRLRMAGVGSHRWDCRSWTQKRSCQSWRWKYQQEYWILAMMVLWIFRQCWILICHISKWCSCWSVLILNEHLFIFDALKKIFTANPLNLNLRNPTPRTESKKRSLFWKHDGNFWQQFCFPTWILFAKATY